MPIEFQRLDNNYMQVSMLSIANTWLDLLPLDLCHIMIAGCVTSWEYTPSEDKITIVPKFPVILIVRDNTPEVVVAEARPSGIEYRSFNYGGSRKLGDRT